MFQESIRLTSLHRRRRSLLPTSLARLHQLIFGLIFIMVKVTVERCNDAAVRTCVQIRQPQQFLIKVRRNCYRYEDPQTINSFSESKPKNQFVKEFRFGDEGFIVWVFSVTAPSLFFLSNFISSSSFPFHGNQSLIGRRRYEEEIKRKK